MVTLKLFKNNNLNIDLENSPVTLQDFNSIIELLNLNPAIQGELEFVIKDSAGGATTYNIISKNSTAKILSNGKEIVEKNFYELIKNSTGLLIDYNDLKSRLIHQNSLDNTQLQQSIKSLNIDPEIQSSIDASLVEEQQLKSKIEESLSSEQKDKYARVIEINGRLEEIQSSIEFYQSEKKIREEINANIKKFNNETQNITQMLESVELLIKSRESLASQLSNFQNSAQSVDEIGNLKRQKYNYLNSKLLSSKVPSLINNDYQDDTPQQKSFKVNINLIIVLLMLNIGISLVGFLYSYNLMVLITGIITTIILMTLYIVSKFFTDTLSEFDTTDNKEYKKEEPKAGFQEQEDPNVQLFINSAWANALRSELESVDNSIKKNLNGKTYESLKSDQDANSRAIESENNRLEELSKKSITSDEYYKKRRESDILKIEKENIEFGLKLDPELLDKQKELKQTLIKLKTKLKTAAQAAESFPVFVQISAENDQNLPIKDKLLNQVVLVKAN